MRVTLNLASRPYVELRPLYQRLRIFIAVLALLAVAFWYVLRSEYAQAKAAQARVDAIQNALAERQGERTRFEALMKQPANAAVLQQAQFLNNLFLRKSFSWTAVMMDLERVLPSGVQVMNIDPSIAKDGHVTLRMRVLGPHERGVDLIRNLEKSRRFLDPRLTAETAETSNTQNASFQQSGAPLGNRVNFEIAADYNPLPVKVERKPAASEGSAVETHPLHKGTRSARKTKPSAKTAAGSGLTPADHAAPRGRAMKFNRGNLLTFLNLHFLILILLGVFNLVLLTRLVLAWNTLRTDRPEQIAEYGTALKTIDLQTAPLRGLPAKVEASGKQADGIYDHRMPGNYSSISAELNGLAQKANVRVARVSLTQVPALQNLAEIRMDASLSGEYAPMMRFINGIERDRMFFIINGLTLTGQQGGTVNVRLKLTTYIHASDVDRMAPPPDTNAPEGDLTSPSASVANQTPSAGGQ